MRTVLAWILLPLIVLAFASCKSRSKKAGKEYNKPLGAGEVALREVDSQSLPRLSLTPASRADMQKGIANSLAYFAKASSDNGFPVAGITKDQVVSSLKALDALLRVPSTDDEFNQQLHSRFRAYMSVGCDDQGTVLYTGYFTPVWPASLTQDATYRFPLYKKPSDLVMPPQGGDPAAGPAQQKMADGSMSPYPKRSVIDGTGMLRGQELVWLSDPFDAYCVQVQG